MDSMYSIHRPIRINFHLLSKCNMNCTYCFKHTNSENSNIEKMKRIIDIIISWDVENITISGGEPFCLSDFPVLLEYLHTESENKDIFIQVDSNGLAIEKKHYRLLHESIDLLGLPLDGSTNEINASMRNHTNHFHTVIKLLTHLQLKIPLKINTVVTTKNIDDLGNLFTLLNNFKIKIWSLYEFWPMELIQQEIINELSLPHDDFISATNNILEMDTPMYIEVNPVSLRKNTYFFVNQAGVVYINSLRNPNEYIEIGSIFSEDIIPKWIKNCRHQESSITHLNTRHECSRR